MAIIKGTVSEKEFRDKLKMFDNKINVITEDFSNKIEKIQDLTGQLPDTEIKIKLNSELSSLKEETELKIKLEQQRLDGLERKSKIWLSFLQRESAASIVGAIVLLLLTFSLIIGMFCGLESQIISNGFLVILGYFFGQSSSRNNKDNNAGGDV